MFSKILVPQILIIERNAQILSILTSCLNPGQQIIEAITSTKQISDKSLSKYSLVIADLNLKETNAVRMISNIKKKNILLPIILVGEDILENKILSYELGINIYHEKPIKCALLQAQLRYLCILKSQETRLRLKDIEIDLSSKGLICNDHFIPLTSREFTLLLILLRAGGRVLNACQISSFSIYSDDEITSSAIHTLVCRIRAKLKDHITEPLILTRRQAGYAINHKYLENISLRQES